jgi:hypothetical protein
LRNRIARTKRRRLVADVLNETSWPLISEKPRHRTAEDDLALENASADCERGKDECGGSAAWKSPYGEPSTASVKNIRFLRTKASGLLCRLACALIIAFGVAGGAAAHTGMVDGYGCHRGKDKVSYHCHQGEFAGRTFKSKEDFLRQLRAGKAEQLSPKNHPPPPVTNLDK